ncbi:butyrophilin subfamily 2 member A2-like [Cyprinodon tularosa]|uniref:butyrophilin subfamily 2 member A2-like n=1 Tax=Cyprinodon tularosa TaxID=77115 RepID=UPI0018E2691A|nr:butyrophilin subfamily 2 member A2-like [Cyprinodon tularosa]
MEVHQMDQRNFTFHRRSSVRASFSIFLLFFLLSLLSGSTSAGVSPQTITAYVGETVILPCRIDVNGELPTLEWSKEGLSPSNITLLYRQGCETFGMKNLAFLYRTNLLLNNLKDGNISLIIYNLKLSDGGTYHCRTLRGKQWQIHAILILNMGAVSEPKLTFVHTTAGGGLTLECKAECWFPEPEITLHDDEGNELLAESMKRSTATAECFTVTRRATVKTHVSRVTCTVHGKMLNQTKKTEIFIPVSLGHCMQSCLNYGFITGIIVLVLTSGTAVCIHQKLWERRRNCCLRRKKSDSYKNDEEKAEKRPKSKHNGTSEPEKRTHDSGSSEQVTLCSSDSRSLEGQSRTSPNPHNTDRPKNTSSKASHLLPPARLQRNLSYRSDKSEDSESLLQGGPITEEQDNSLPNSS